MPGEPEIVLPCLDEADALPAVLAALPDGWPVLVVDNGSTDDTAAVAATLGARVVVEPRRGYGAAVHAGLLAARADVVAVLDGDGSLDPDVLPALADEVLAGRADLAVGRRVPTSAGVWPWHARAGNFVIAAILRRRGVPVHDIAPIRVARREALLDLRVADRASGYPLEMLLRGRGGLADRGAARALSRSGRWTVQGFRLGARVAARCTGHGRAAAVTPLVLLVLAKAPEPGRVKTRLCPPATPDQAADLAAAALLDTLDAVRGVPSGHPVIAIAGRLAGAARAREITAMLRGVPTLEQRGADLSQRIAAAHADAGALLPGLPILQLGADTPQVDARLLLDAAAPLHRGVDAVVGPARDGGWWALGVRDPHVASAIAGVPTSRPDTGDRTIHALRSAGLRVELLPVLTDVDTFADALLVAGTAPRTRFAAALAEQPWLTTRSAGGG